MPGTYILCLISSIIQFGKMARRNRISKSSLCWLIIATVVLVFIYKLSTSLLQNPQEIVIVSVVCSEESIFEEFTAMVKSAVLCQMSSKLKFIILSDENFFARVDNYLMHLKTVMNDSFSYKLLPVAFPGSQAKHIAERDGSTVCGSQRIYLPDILPDENYILYVDTDVIFLNKLSVAWERFISLSTGHLAVMMRDSESLISGMTVYPATSRENGYPIYGEFGINSGIMFMNLDKMREFNWVERSNHIMAKYKNKTLMFFDQDIINIVFHDEFPDKLQVGPCSLNFRNVHCISKNDCEDSEANGVSLLHGFANTFHQLYGDMLVFNAIYQSFLKYEIGTDLYENLLLPLLSSIHNLPPSNCKEQRNVILHNFIGLYIREIVHTSS